MKTIQEYLKTCNKDNIAQIFFSNYILGDDITLLELKNITISEIEAGIYNKVKELIERLINTNPSVDDPHILLAVHSTEPTDIRAMLVNQQEVLEDEDAASYSYEFCEFEEVVGYYVADTYLTQHYIEEVIADFLFHVSVTGFDHEHLQSSIERIEASLRECQEHQDDPDYFFSHEEVIKHLEEQLGIKPEEKDPKQEEAKNQYTIAKAKYDSTCKKIEIEKLRSELCKEIQQK